MSTGGGSPLEGSYTRGKHRVNTLSREGDTFRVYLALNLLSNSAYPLRSEAYRAGSQSVSSLAVVDWPRENT